MIIFGRPMEHNLAFEFQFISRLLAYYALLNLLLLQHLKNHQITLGLEHIYNDAFSKKKTLDYHLVDYNSCDI